MQLNGPIPGENYTSDTKNYAWHRPPEFTDLDKAIEASSKQLMSEDGLSGLISLMQSGMNIAQLTTMFVISGVGAGKWTMDFALLLAGPISHVMYLLAKGYDIKVDLGIEREPNTRTKSYFEAIKIGDEQLSAIKDIVKNQSDEIQQEVQQSVGGFMSMPMGNEGAEVV
jgi:hypothetical protein